VKAIEVTLHQQLLKHTADHASTHIYIGVYSIIISSMVVTA